jgi:hypothetical protein
MSVCLASISCSETARINTFPQGARVWVNGRDLGEAPVKFSVKSWSVRSHAYHYHAEKPGYLTKDGYLEPHLSIGRIIAAGTSSCITCFHGFYEFDEDTEIVLQQDPLLGSRACPPLASPTPSSDDR